MFEHIAIAVLAAAILAMILLIIFLWKKKALERIHQNIVEPIPISTQIGARDFKIGGIDDEINQ